MNSNPILALIAFRDEQKHLPGLFSHLRDYVDGFVAFNDCSTDASAEIAKGEPKVLKLIERHVPSQDHRFEVENRKALLQSANELGARWLLCCDADERFETGFLEQLRALIDAPPATIIGLRCVAVWENFQQYRQGNFRKYVLFPSVPPAPYYAPGQLHQQWFPPRMTSESKKTLDFNLYHLGSMTWPDRLARYEKFERIDPQHAHQPQGYKNLISESDVVVVPIPPSKSFRYE